MGVQEIDSRPAEEAEKEQGTALQQLSGRGASLVDVLYSAPGAHRERSGSFMTGEEGMVQRSRLRNISGRSVGPESSARYRASFHVRTARRGDLLDFRK